MQHSQDLFALTFLELTTSDSDGKTPFVGEIVSNAAEPRSARRDRNFRLAIPSLIVNNHRPGFSSAQLLIRHGSHSS